MAHRVCQRRRSRQDPRPVALVRVGGGPHTTGDVVFLVGSALTAPTERDGPGVPGVEAMIEMIRTAELAEPVSRERFEASLQAEPGNRYQAAFKHLANTRGADAMNRVVRRSVLKAYTRPLPAEQALDDAAATTSRSRSPRPPAARSGSPGEPRSVSGSRSGAAWSRR